MIMPAIDMKQLSRIIRRSVEEDIGTGDVTSSALIPSSEKLRASIVSREAGVLAGLIAAREVFHQIDPRTQFAMCLQDGEHMPRDALIAEVSGSARCILAAERTALNFLQRLSGIATLTAAFVKETEDTAAQIYDTRKTTPGWRALEKYAVRAGGGCNHRMGLYDQVLIKDNHIALRPDMTLREIVEQARKNSPTGTLVEIEVDSLEQLQQCLDACPDIVLLDNMPVEMIARAVAIVHKAADGTRPQLEASGGITRANVKRYAETGVDRISVGAITHSARALDISLDI